MKWMLLKPCKTVMLLFFLLLLFDRLPAVPLRKAVSEAVEAAAGISRRALDDTMRISLQKSLTGLCRRYGDDALKVVSRGGLEAMEAGLKYGDDFWRAARNAPPAAIRSLALHADEMLPAAEAVGKEFLILESRVPGLALDAFRIYGADGVRYLSHIPEGDAAKLIAYGSRRSVPEASGALLEGYRRSSGKILNFLDGKKIMAAGLSVAAVTAAYNVGDGIGDGFRELSEKDPEAFGKVVSNVTLPFWLLFSGCVMILLMPYFVSALRRAARELRRKSSSDSE